METKDQKISFRQIIEDSPVALLLMNDKGKIIFLNNFTEKLFGYQKKELEGQTLDILLKNMYAGHSSDFWINYMNNPTPIRLGGNYTLKALKKSGKEFPVELRMKPVQTKENIYILTTINSISEQLKANEQLKLTIESALNAMILIGSSGKIAMVNKQTEVLFGYERNELIGKKIEILVPQRMRQHHPEHRKKFHANPKARPMGAGRDLFGIKKDGTEIPVEIGLNPVIKDGEQLVLASVIDITERKKNEDAIRLYARQIEEKNKELEEFTNIASHDLREPLNSIITLTDLLMKRKSDQLDEEGIQMLDYIGKSSSRMTELITGLLDYARLGNSKKLVMTDLNELLMTVLLDLDSSIEASKAEVHADKMPVLNVYTMEFRLLFQNLISNAIKYRKPDISPKISVSAKQVHGGWQFSVSDNGIGIPPNHKEKIFNLFHRVHRRSDYEGTGIGLAHCRKIAELHRGKIWVESELGIGSTFCFFIPSGLI